MSAAKFKSWLTTQDPAVELEDAMAKGEQMGLRSYKTSEVLRDMMDEGGLKGGFIKLGDEVQRVGFAGKIQAVSEAIESYENDHFEEVSDEISRMQDVLESMNRLHQEYDTNTSEAPYGDFSHEDVENFGDQTVEILLNYGEEALDMESSSLPDVGYVEKDNFNGGHSRIEYTRGDEKSNVENLEDIFELDFQSAVPTPIELFHEASHIATEELAQRQYEAEGNDDDLGNYVSGYLDENSEEAANELMMYTWNQATSNERGIISAGADVEKFEEALDSYLEITKTSTPDYRDQHPIEGTEQSISSIYN